MTRAISDQNAGNLDNTLDQYWAYPTEVLLRHLGTDSGGLTSVEADRRLRRYGLNILHTSPRLAAVALFARQFKSPLILILIVGSLIAAILQDWIDAGIVLAVVVGSGTLGFFQEYKASQAVRALRDRVRTRSATLRDGREIPVPSDHIVPGDIVLLSSGSLVPGDCVLLETKDLYVAQANLTGESFPVEKSAGVSAPSTPVGDRLNCIYMGTSVRSGTARALVVKTGAATVYGGISDRLRLQEPETDFERGIRHYGYMLTQIMLLLVLVVFASNVFLDRPPIDSLMFAIALAVGMSPELLPAIVSVTLAKGASRMAAYKVIVRRLNAIENLGSLDVLCADKTGTLTQGVMALERTLDINGGAADSVMRLAYLNATFQTGMANPIDDAIVARAKLDNVDISAFRKLDEVPYDFVRKRVSVVVANNAGSGAQLIVKGAVENVLAVCSHTHDGARSNTLNTSYRERIAAQFQEWSGKGYRVLAVAEKPVPVDQPFAREDEADLAFVGFLLFLDPPKEGIREVLSAFRERNIRLKIITGDNRLVAAYIADAVGLNGERLLTGSALNTLRDEALGPLAEKTDLFAEVDPHQKERIISALRKAGRVVGYLGDGINDAPALQAADVGISVDQAADVAKESADFVLLEHDLSVLQQGVDQGRITFANTLKYISITTSANFGNMLSMAAMSLFMPFLPLLAKQILLNNFLSDVPALTIASDAVDRELIERPRRWSISEIRRFMLTFGLISSAFDFLVVGILLLIFVTPAELFQTAWFIESLLTELAIMLVIRTNRPFYASRPGRGLLISTFAVACLTLALPYLPYAEIFGFVPLPAPILISLLMATCGYVAASEIAKRLLYGRSAT
jgi:Mg2+-importing ATPase